MVELEWGLVQLQENDRYFLERQPLEQEQAIQILEAFSKMLVVLDRDGVSDFECEGIKAVYEAASGLIMLENEGERVDFDLIRDVMVTLVAVDGRSRKRYGFEDWKRILLETASLWQDDLG